MTHDPDRDTRAPVEVNQDTRPYDRPPYTRQQGNGLGIMLGLMAALLIGGFVFYNASRSASVATDRDSDARPPLTTGAGSAAPRDPSANAPVPAPRLPAPAQQQ